MSKKLTIADLLAQKDKIKKKEVRTLELHVETLGGEITIQEPSRSIAIEAIEMAQDETRIDMADIHVVYHSVVEPNLKDPKLQQEFGCAEPTDIVAMIFRPGEISTISGHALQLAGYGNGVRKIDKDLKN